ncbi:MAG: DUF4421 domain-containing protein [Muribaculaceae bacterium]
MKRYYLLLLFVAFTSSFSYGFKIIKLDSILGPRNIILRTYKWVDKAFNSYDSAYVAGTGKYFNFKIKNDNWIDTYTFGYTGNKHVVMNSDFSSHIGVSLGYRAVSIGYMMNVKNAFKKDSPSRKRADFSFTCSRVICSAYYSINEDAPRISKFGNLSRLNYRFDDGLKTESYGLELIYIFNNRRFSQAASNYSRIQKRSSGTLYGGVSIAAHDLKLDFSKLPQEMKNELPNDNYFYRFKYNDYSFIIGYGYNWVFAKRWLLSASLTPMMGFKHCKEQSTEGERDLFSINASAKLSVVYNKSRYFAGLICQYNTYSYLSDDYSVTNSIGTFNICAGVRF